MSDEKLKPCPFCGGEAAVKSRTAYDYVIMCRDCYVNDESNNWSQTKEEAIDAWNRRVK